MSYNNSVLNENVFEINANQTKPLYNEEEWAKSEKSECNDCVEFPKSVDVNHF